MQHLTDLVDGAAVRRGPAAPLLAIDRTQLAVFGGPVIPDGDVVLPQITDIGLAREKPEQLMNNRTQMQFLGGQQRKALRQIETHLITEEPIGPRTGAVVLVHTLFARRTQKLEILFHVWPPARRYAQTINPTPAITRGTLNSWPMVSQPKAR